MSYQTIINNITENILKNIKKAIDTESHSDQTFCAKVTEILSEDKIKVLYSGNTYISSTSFPCKINEIVKICAPQNNWNELFALCKNVDIDLANSTLNEIEKNSAAFPSFSPKETLKVIFGKIEKWQQDCLAKFGDYVLKSMLTSQHINSEDSVPTSALVFSMQESITGLNNDLSNNYLPFAKYRKNYSSDLNNLTESGFYVYFTNAVGNLPDYTSDNAFHVIVIKSDKNNIIQIWLGYLASNIVSVYMRAMWAGEWRNWKKLSN